MVLASQPSPGGNKLRIVDAHQHFWTREESGQRKRPPELQKILVNNFLPADLKPLLDEVGVQQTILVQYLPSLDNTQKFLSYADTYDWIGAVVGWVDLTNPQVGDVLDRLRQHSKFRGVRHQWEDEADPAWALRPEVMRGLRQVAERDLTFDLLVKPRNWEYIPELAATIPELSLVIDHIGKPRIREGQFNEWVQAMAIAAEFPQMTCKLSGMTTEAHRQDWTPATLQPYVDEVIELFGADRIMFGSDWPVCLTAGTYVQVFNATLTCLADLSETERNRILGANAAEFYRID